MKNIGAIIVCFNPEINRLRENLNSIAKQVEMVYIIDNGSSNLGCYQYLSNEFNNLVIYKLGANKGIAAALNTGLRVCANRYEWVVTLDQDSQAAPDMVAMLQSYIHNNECAIISPTIIDINFQNNKVFNNSKPIKVDSAITSGCLNNVNILLRIGGFDEKMFIDYVDHDICFRLRIAGYSIIQNPKAVLYQEVGHISSHKLCGISISTTNHKPFRRYFLFRNKIYMYKKYCFIFPKWCILNFLSSIKVFLRIILFEKNKYENLVCITTGVIDGLFNTFDNTKIFNKIT